MTANLSCVQQRKFCSLEKCKSVEKVSTFKCQNENLTPHYCRFCFFVTDLKVILTHHTRVVHKKRQINTDLTKIPKYYECKKCNFSSFSAIVFTKHVAKNCKGVCQKVTNTPFEKSNYYPYVLKLSKEIRMHFILDHTDPRCGKGFKCERCTFNAERSRFLKLHVKKLHAGVVDKDTEWHKCDHCFYKTKWKFILAQHVYLDHTPEAGTLFTCYLCTYKTSWIYSLKRHMTVIHNIPIHAIALFECGLCKYRSQTKFMLERHMDSQHGKPTAALFHCKQCSFKTMQEPHLKNHVAANHPTLTPVEIKRPIPDMRPVRIKWFECGQCSHREASIMLLSKHVCRK